MLCKRLCKALLLINPKKGLSTGTHFYSLALLDQVKSAKGFLANEVVFCLFEVVFKRLCATFAAMAFGEGYPLFSAVCLVYLGLLKVTLYFWPS